jgi:hypothetical protein
MPLLHATRVLRILAGKISVWAACQAKFSYTDLQNRFRRDHYRKPGSPGGGLLIRVGVLEYTRHAFAPLRQWRMLGNLDHYREKQVLKDPAFS